MFRTRTPTNSGPIFSCGVLLYIKYIRRMYSEKYIPTYTHISCAAHNTQYVYAGAFTDIVQYTTHIYIYVYPHTYMFIHMFAAIYVRMATAAAPLYHNINMPPHRFGCRPFRKRAQTPTSYACMNGMYVIDIGTMM